MSNRIFSIFIIIAMFLCISNNVKAQDPAFSQFYANPLYLNPAFAGASEGGCPRATLNYRDQWPGISRAYVTTSASWDQHVKAGFEASYRMITLNWEDFTFGDMIDPQFGFIYPTNEDIANYPTTKGIPDFSTGFLAYTNNFFAGFAAHHLTQPNDGFISESELPTKITAHIGGNLPLSKYKNTITTISPNFLYQKQKDFQQFNYGLYVNRGPVVGGLWARNSAKNFDSFILMVGLIQDSFKFG